MDELVKDRAMQHLIKQGMNKREAEHEIEFNRELFMKLTVKYGVPLKTDYLESTDKMVSAVFSSCTGDPSPMRKAKLNVDIDDSKVQKVLKDVDKVADKILKIKDIPDSLKVNIKKGQVNVKHNNSFNGNKILQNVAISMAEDVKSKMYGPSEKASMAHELFNIIQYLNNEYRSQR